MPEEPAGGEKTLLGGGPGGGVKEPGGEEGSWLDDIPMELKADASLKDIKFYRCFVLL